MNHLQQGSGYQVPSDSAAREQHHHRLEKIINEMAEVVMQLQLLLDKIQHGNTSNPVKSTDQISTVAEVSSLAAVLHSAPDHLREIKNKQLDLIQAINDQLF